VGAWLSNAWIADTKELGQAMPERPGANGVVQYYVLADVERPYYWVIRDGRLADAGLEEHPAPDVAITVDVEVARAMQTGELEPTTAFMEGKLEVEGNLDLLVELLPITSSEQYRNLERELARRTDFDRLGD
jgi:putative sterol carrier protein